MLVLSRKDGEKIIIEDNITITVVRIGSNSVRLGIDAPMNMKIMRYELTLDIAPGSNGEFKVLDIIAAAQASPSAV